LELLIFFSLNEAFYDSKDFTESLHCLAKVEVEFLWAPKHSVKCNFLFSFQAVNVVLYLSSR